MLRPNLRTLSNTLLELLFGIGLGYCIIEATLQVNPKLLIQGMDTPLPVHESLVSHLYPVRYSDGDLFFWQPETINPVTREQDVVETMVDFKTDEFGFPNVPPGVQDVDIIVLGRSFSLGAQAGEAWPQGLERISGMEVLNLSQTGSGIARKIDYLVKFSPLMNARWIVLEVLPSLDLFSSPRKNEWLVNATTVAILQNSYRRAGAGSLAKSNLYPVFPIFLKVNGREIQYADYLYYLSALTVAPESVVTSNSFHSFQIGLEDLVHIATNNGACVILLHIPTKSEVMLPLVENHEDLEPVLPMLLSWDIHEEGLLIQSQAGNPTTNTLVTNAENSSLITGQLASQNNIPWIDPSDALRNSIRSGENPYLVYDTHWSNEGHAIVARMVLSTIESVGCTNGIR